MVIFLYTIPVKMSSIPTIRISHAHLLQNVQLKSVQNPSPNLTSEELEDITASYRRAWQSVQSAILPAMQGILGVSFRQPIIDVAIAPWQEGAGISFPLIIDAKPSPDEFVDTLTHELFHVLLTDNNIFSNKEKKSQNTLNWEAFFGENHPGTTLIHIGIHACCKYIYLDVLKDPKRLKRDIDHCKQYPDYQKAWEYVESNDYHEIIRKIKTRYKR